LSEFSGSALSVAIGSGGLSPVNGIRVSHDQLSHTPLYFPDAWHIITTKKSTNTKNQNHPWKYFVDILKW